MNVELIRYRVKKNKSERVDEWLKFLNANMGSRALSGNLYR